MNNSKITEGLNPQQKDAVTTVNGPMLIIAGAGSGKTRVITNRIAYLIERGVKPYNILALTFTNKAAAEMKNRIANIIEPHEAERVWAGTFHSIFARLLRYDCNLIGYDSSFSIYDSDDSLSIVRKVLQEMNIESNAFSPQSVRSRISSMKSKMMTASDIRNNPKSHYDKTFADIYSEYDKRLFNNNAMDFDDLLNNFIKLLETSKDTLLKYQDKFRYILVDEYQDTNFSQYKAVNLLANNYRNICVVGDDAQSIYGWRGADIRNILDFQKDYHDCKVFKLEQNYRSTKTILEAADCVIKHNAKQLPKKLRTDNPQGELIDLIDCENDLMEAETIISIIKSKISSGQRRIKDFAVLYRTNAQSLPFEKACRRFKIPYIIIGGMSFYRRKEVKDVLSYLRILMNPNDGESFLRIVNEPPRGLGQTSLNHINNYAKFNHKTLLEAFGEAPQIAQLQKRAAVAALNFAQFINKYRALLNDEPSSYPEIVKDYISETGIISILIEIGTDEAKERVRNIEQLVNDISLFAMNNPDETLSDYLQQISLISDLDDKEFDGDRLPLMTLHSAKGLEFKEVFIAGLERGLFPLFRKDKDDSGEEEEERRLFYVGITRAEENLHLSYANQRMKFGSIQVQAPSPFLREIDAELMKSKFGEQLNSRGVENSNTFKKPVAKSNSSYFNDIPQKDYYSQVEEHSFKIGDLVRHKQFGVGKVIGLSGSGANSKATVNFSNVGKKTLVLLYAKLELVKQAR